MDELPKGNASRITRRTVLKAAAIATAAVGVRHPARAQTPADDNTTGTIDSSQGLNPSPATTPYMMPLPVYRPKTPVSALAPDFGEYPSGEECGRDRHQRYADFPNVTTKYELFVREAWHSYHPQMPNARVWGYDGVVPGPTFVARYGKPCVVRIHNMLPLNHIGFGSPEISTHLHNAHCGSESDGFTGNYFSVAKAGPTLGAPGRYQDHFYPNVYAGFDAYRATNGDPREALGTLWYHDHRMDFTAPNVYRGLA
ncbi:MAG: multicopper oxidase domain-containing protein, partial [Lacisediminimonas sp.]|nr:multicopper oxidase domain-containing protein [Lacisediminimonas sp.]